MIFICIFSFICSMKNNKRYTLQNALAIMLGDDSEFEGCDNSSDEDPDDPNYTPNNKDMENDESSESDDSESSESNDLDEVPQPNMDPEQQNTTVQRKKQGTEQGKTFSWRKKSFEAPECTFKGPQVTPPDNLLTPLEYFRKFITPEMLELLGEQLICTVYKNLTITTILTPLLKNWKY